MLLALLSGALAYHRKVRQLVSAAVGFPHRFDQHAIEDKQKDERDEREEGDEPPVVSYGVGLGLPEGGLFAGIGRRSVGVRFNDFHFEKFRKRVC